MWWAVAGASLWLRSGFAIFAIGGAGLDDALFIRLARYLGAGLWLGPFDDTTLVKGMFYPLFILLSFAAGIPLKLAEQGVYLAASAFVSLLVVRAERRRCAGTVLFAALAFNPVLWNAELARVIREGLYISLSLAVVGLLVAVAVPRRGSLAGGLARGLALGVVGGGFWLTREEGVWLLPSAGLVLILGFAGAAWRWLDHGRQPGAAQWLTATGVPLLVAVLGFAGVVGGVMAQNQRYYGVAETVEVKSPAFEHAYGAISRIAQQNWRRYVVFPKDARELAYGVSPAARELKPALDGVAAETWLRVGCQASPMPDCTEIQASWFQWALRDAVKDAGHYHLLREAARFYERLAQEIDGACDRAAIPCLPARASLAPPFRWHYLADALPAARTLTGLLLRLGGDTVQRQPSIGTNVAIDLFAETAGPVARGTTSWTITEGWVGTPSGTALLSVRPPAGLAVRTELLATPGDAARAEFPSLTFLHFRLVTDCPPQQCDLVVGSGDRTLATLKVADLGTTTRLVSPDLAFGVDGTATHIAAQGQDRRNAVIERIARPIGHVYARVMPVLTVIGAIGLLVTALVRRSAALRSPSFVLAAAGLAALASRIALLAYVDVTSISSANLLYAAPAAPFVVVLGVVGCMLLLDLVPLAYRRYRDG